MKKFVKKMFWWIFTICLIITGSISFLLLKGIEWADPIDECECGDPIHNQEQ